MLFRLLPNSRRGLHLEICQAWRGVCLLPRYSKLGERWSRRTGFASIEHLGSPIIGSNLASAHNVLGRESEIQPCLVYSYSRDLQGGHAHGEEWSAIGSGTNRGSQRHIWALLSEGKGVITCISLSNEANLKQEECTRTFPVVKYERKHCFDL